MPHAPTPTTHEIDYLDHVAATGAGRDYKGRLRDALDLHAGHTVLDVGCGPATDLGPLARAVGPHGRVIGLDHDLAMLAEAHRRTADQATIELCQGDAHALPMAERSADRARCDRVLMHLADPARAVAELRRVLHPGGLATLAEPDWDTLAIDDEDLATSRAYARYVATQVVRNGAIGRALARLLVQAGFELRSVQATPVVFHDYAAANEILHLPQRRRPRRRCRAPGGTARAGVAGAHRLRAVPGRGHAVHRRGCGPRAAPCRRPGQHGRLRVVPPTATLARTRRRIGRQHGEDRRGLGRR